MKSLARLVASRCLNVPLLTCECGGARHVAADKRYDSNEKKQFYLAPPHHLGT